MTDQSSKSPTLHRAAYLAPVTSPLIEDGAVLVADCRILKVGRFADLRHENSHIKDHGDRLLCPGLINAHSHLELSGLAHMGQKNDFFEPGDITAWIETLLNTRAENEDQQAVSLAVDQLHANGTALVADIGNLEQSSAIGGGKGPDIRFFLEIMGLTPMAVSEAGKRLASLEDYACTGHAPYSTAAELLCLLKKRASNRGDIFPIHLAESHDEVEFLTTGQGRFREFLDRRLAVLTQGRGPGIDQVFSAPGLGPVQYLDDLGVLGPDTLCVHCVQVGEQEIDLLARRGASVCLCPTSNNYLGVGRAPAARMTAAGLTPCLGTDSLASTSTLSIWHEMQLLSQEQPDLGAQEIFAMATINGAKALQVDQEYGSLEAGKRAAILSVELDGPHVFEQLVHNGPDPDIAWLGECDE